MTNIELKNKIYYSSFASTDKLIDYKYNNLLTKFINFIEENREDKIKINLINSIKNKLINVIIIGHDKRLTNLNFVPTQDLYFAVLKIYNIVKDYECNKD